MKKFSFMLCLLLQAAAAPHGEQPEVRIGVLGLFHPQQLVLSPIEAHPLECADGEERWAVEKPVRLELEGTAIGIGKANNTSAPVLNCDDGQGGDAEFAVTVPGKLTRRYRGKLEVAADAGELLIVVKMPLETAVASIVAAESPPHAPLEALKAQAVATRSFLVAGKGRHSSFDFCDTTHCQFLREPPAAESPAAQAAKSTLGLVVAYNGRTFAAMYSASCGGKTHSLAELGIATASYPYFAVNCDYCRRHPQKWVARISHADADELEPTESSRLRLARRLGWRAVPGNSYSARTENGEVILEGSGAGHGIGLCQRGGAEMARRGATFQHILEHYYPNTELKQF
jgi:peptidoglycan hydrolase-like amidase